MFLGIPAFSLHLASQGIKWNFTKFLVAKNASVKKRYASATKPEALNDDIFKMLQA
jgi:glutathione peroxidase